MAATIPYNRLMPSDNFPAKSLVNSGHQPSDTCRTTISISTTCSTPLCSGPPGPIRTAYPLVRSQVLYPNELRAVSAHQRTRSQSSHGRTALASPTKTKRPVGRLFSSFLAEREGFEPSVPCSTPDFESGTIDHSATSPTGPNLSTSCAD